MHRASLAVLLLLTPILATASPDADDGPSTFEEVVRPYLVAHCHLCHGDSSPQGKLSLSRFSTTEDALGAPAVWRRVRERIERSEMPPGGMPRGSETERERVLSWLRSRVPDVPARPTATRRVTARRLNRVEYRNTILDLLGVDYAADETFPADDVGHGFDNVGDVLSLSPALLETYLVAAERIAAQAVADEQQGEAPTRRYAGPDMKAEGGARQRGQEPWALFAPSRISTPHRFPRAGTYVIRVEAHGMQAGPEPARMTIRVGRRDVETFDVAAEQEAPETYAARAVLKAGKQSVSVAFVNDYYDPKHADPTQRDRNLYVHAVEVLGPVDPPVLPLRQRDLVSTVPSGGDWRPVVRRAVAWLLPRAWRRPVREGEVERLVGVVDSATGPSDSVSERVRVAIVATLTAPSFLYRWEPGPSSADAAGDAARPLTDHELASRLSYFLWSSMPDDRLRAAADEGRLQGDAALRAETLRMLRDPRARALAENFATQWLQIRDVRLHRPAPGLFPGVDADLLADMEAETKAFFEAVLREQRDVRELLSADFTFLNERLAAHYGVVGVRGRHFRRVALPAGRPGGLLSHASILTATSNPDRTSPPRRGKWILEALLDQAPPPPPPDAGILDESQGRLDAASFRKRFEQHRRDPACAACHVTLDPLGFALENYDAVGRWRTHDAGVAIDASTELPDGRAIEGGAALGAVLATDGAFLRSLSRHLLTYALGRGVDAGDDADVQRLVADLEDEGTLTRLILEIVDLETFRTRPPATLPPATEEVK